MEICTIGFSKKDLRDFIRLLKDAGVKKVIDVRVHNTSQLAGYTKKQDLQYILELVGMDYEHVLELAPTEELMKNYRSKKISRDEFRDMYIALLSERKPLESFDLSRQPDSICLLCAEEKPEHCHRSFAAQYMQDNYTGQEIRIRHL